MRKHSSITGSSIKANRRFLSLLLTVALLLGTVGTLGWGLVAQAADPASSIEVGVYYRLRNAYYNTYLTVNGCTDANGTNVHGYEEIDPIPPHQMFTFYYDAGLSAYRLRAVCSNLGTNRVLDIDVGSDGLLNAGDNVMLNAPNNDNLYGLYSTQD